MRLLPWLASLVEKNYRRCGMYAIIETGGKQLKVEAGDGTS